MKRQLSESPRPRKRHMPEPVTPPPAGSGEKHLVFGGCFCPPHRGHYESLVKQLPYFDHIHVYLYHKADQRHGFSHDVNNAIWRIYLKTLKTQDRTKVSIRSNPFYKTEPEPHIGGARDVKRRYPKAKISFLVGSDYDHRFLQQWMNNNMGNQMGRIIISEREQNLSATNFVQILTNGEPIDYFLPKSVREDPHLLREVLEILMSEQRIVASSA
jgi:nicotinic acid mononucleotide adenylyltransferase